MEKSVFLREQGNTPVNRIWSFLIVHQEFDYSMKDIAKYAGVSYTTLKRMWPHFKGHHLVMLTRKVGKAKMYKLYLKNPVVKKFIEFYWTVTSSAIRGENKVDFSGAANIGTISAKSI